MITRGGYFLSRPEYANLQVRSVLMADEEFKKVIDEIRMQIFILKQRLDEFEEN